jgi:hypothetical protein
MPRDVPDAPVLARRNRHIEPLLQQYHGVASAAAAYLMVS